MPKPTALVSVEVRTWQEQRAVCEALERLGLAGRIRVAPPSKQPASKKKRSSRPREMRFDKPVFKLHGPRACPQCGHGSRASLRYSSMDGYLNPHAAAGLCDGCLAVHLRSLLVLVPHSDDPHAPMGNRALTADERAIVEERLAELAP